MWENWFPHNLNSRVLFSFAGIAITNYHKLGGLERLNRSQKFKIQVSAWPCSHERFWEDSFLVSSCLWWFVAPTGFLGLWQHHSSLCLHLRMAFFQCDFLSLILTPVTGLRAHPNPVCLLSILTSSYLQRPYFQTRSQSEVLGGYESWEETIQPSPDRLSPSAASASQVPQPGSWPQSASPFWPWGCWPSFLALPFSAGPQPKEVLPQPRPSFPSGIWLPRDHGGQWAGILSASSPRALQAHPSFHLSHLPAIPLKILGISSLLGASFRTSQHLSDLQKIIQTDYFFCLYIHSTLFSPLTPFCCLKVVHPPIPSIHPLIYQVPTVCQAWY